MYTIYVLYVHEDYGEVKPRETGGIPVEYVNRRREDIKHCKFYALNLS